MAGTKSHCSQCGREDEATQYNEGYSSCCNKRICGGLNRYSSGHKFGTPTIFVRSCCWGRAAEIFAESKIAIPEGSSQFE